MSLTPADLDLLQAVAQRSITRNTDGTWIQHHIQMPTADGARLDEHASRGLIALHDTGAGYSTARLTGKGGNAVGELTTQKASS